MYNGEEGLARRWCSAADEWELLVMEMAWVGGVGGSEALLKKS